MGDLVDVEHEASEDESTTREEHGSTHAQTHRVGRRDCLEAE